MGTTPLATRYASLITRAVPDGDHFERPLTVLESGIFQAAALAAAQGARGFAILRLGLRVHGVVEVGALGRALDHLVGAHDVMRTTYVLRDGAPVARVHRTIAGSVRVVDCIGEEARADAVVAEELARDFDLGVGPPHRFLIVRTAPDRLVFAHFASHIACDGASYLTMFRDLETIYAALLAGRAAPAPSARRFSYADYAEWQTRSFDQRDRDEHLAFWGTHLDEQAQRPPIAEIGERRISQTPRRWAETRIATADGVGSRAAAFARDRGTSPAHVFFAALLALQHAEGAAGAPVGFVSANRRRETLRIVGMFAALFPLRVPTTGAMSFTELLARANETLAAAYEHQELAHTPKPFPEPAFRVVFNFLAKPVVQRSILGLPTEDLFAFEKPRALYDLWLNLSLDQEGRLSFRAEHAVDLIDVPMLEGHLARYAALIVHAVAHPEQSLDALAAAIGRHPG